MLGGEMLGWMKGYRLVLVVVLVISSFWKEVPVLYII